MGLLDVLKTGANKALSSLELMGVGWFGCCDRGVKKFVMRWFFYGGMEGHFMLLSLYSLPDRIQPAHNTILAHSKRCLQCPVK
jgi:hypothetical protein